MFWLFVQENAAIGKFGKWISLVSDLTKSNVVEAALIWIDVTWTPAYGSPGLHNAHSCENCQSFQTFLNSMITLWYDNKLASLEATLVGNYDRLTHRRTDGGEV